MDFRFKAENDHDIATHEEFTKAYNRAQPRSILSRILLILFMLWYISMFSIRYIVILFLIYAVTYGITALRNKKRGDIAYRRMVTANGGRSQHAAFFFRDENILETELNNGNQMTYSYEQFKGLIETKNLLILVMPDQLALVLSKDTLTGGTVDGFKAWFFEKCPNIKRKKLLSTRFGKWVDWIFLVTMIVGVLLAVLDFPSFSIWERLSGKLHNDMTYQEMATELGPLGITISPQTIEEIQSYDAEYAPGQDYYDVYYDSSKIVDLLCWEGTGTYEEGTWEWTPSTSGIYWFDMEVMDAGAIYTDFLTGVSAMDEDLRCTNIREDYSQVDMEVGTGTVYFSFDWAGETYQMEAGYDYDWFDIPVLYEFCSIINERSSEKQLFYTYDSGQGFLLYYGTPAQVKQLEKMTGLSFSDDLFLHP